LPSKQQRTAPFLALDWIPSLARFVFQAAPAEEKRCGCQLIVAAAHPTENFGDVPWSRTYVWTFSQRNNFVSDECRGDHAIGIGNGSDVSTYVNTLRDARRNSFFLQLITHGEGAQAQYLAKTMRESVLTNPKAGVSPYFQMGIVTRGQALLGNYNYTRFEQDGTRKRIHVPPVAQTYKAFQDFCRTGKLNPTCVVC